MDLGPYRLLERIGAGGMGTVHRAELQAARHGLPAGARVAVKIVHPHLLETEGYVERFLREAEIGMRVDHENVVRTYACEAVATDGHDHHLLVMEHVEGRTLLDLVEELGRVPEALCRHIAREVARGLDAIHASGIVHRDLKPENVLITRDHVVKVMDLGIAHLQDEAIRLSRTGQFLGTLAYAAPEQLGGGTNRPDARTDLYALGALLYHLLAGRPPHHAKAVGDLIRRVLETEPVPLAELEQPPSPFFQSFVHTLLAKTPADRLPDADAVRTILREGEQAAWWRTRQAVRAPQAVAREPRIPVARASAVFGRDDELGRLRSALEASIRGDGRVVLVEGEAGVGKSRLLDEFVSRARQAGVGFQLLYGAVPPTGSATAWAAFAAAFGGAFASEHLRQGVAEHLDGDRALADVFAAVLSDDIIPTEHVAILTEELLQTLFVRVARSLAGEQPLVILIDDLHAAPEAGRTLFTALARAARDHRILLVGTLRSSTCDAWLASMAVDAGGERIALGRLGPKDLYALLEDTFGSEETARELGMPIAVKSDGNPFFAFEIIRSLQEAGHVERHDDATWRVPRALERIELPSSILGLIQARLDHLGEEERSLLELASCDGVVFDPSLLAAVRGGARIQVLQQCARIERRHGLIRSTDRGYAFDHPQVRDVIHDALHQQLRESYHALYAEELAARGSTTPPSPAEAVALCEHAWQGARPALCGDHMHAALAHLAATWDWTRAARLATACLEAPGLLTGAARVDVLLRHADALGPMGRAEQHETVLGEAVALVATLDDPARHAAALLAQGRFFVNVARYDEADAALAEAQAAAAAARREDLQVDVALSRAQIAQTRGNYDEAGALVAPCLAVAQAAGDATRESEAHLLLANLANQRGDPEAATDHGERALALAESRGDPASASRAHLLLGIRLVRAGEFERAAAHFEQALALARQMGSRRRELQVRTNLANCRSAQGRSAVALALFRPQLPLARELGARRSEAIVLVNLSAVLTDVASLDEALEHAEASLALTRELGVRRVESYALHQRACVHRCRGDLPAAERDFTAALSIREEIGHLRGVASSLCMLADLRTEAGDEDGARALLVRAAGVVGPIGEPNYEIMVWCRRAALGAVPYDEAAARLDAAGARMSASDQREAHWQLWRASGQARHLEVAHALQDYELAHAPADRREAIRGRRDQAVLLEAWANARG